MPSGRIFFLQHELRLYNVNDFFNCRCLSLSPCNFMCLVLDFFVLGSDFYYVQTPVSCSRKSFFPQSFFCLLPPSYHHSRCHHFNCGPQKKKWSKFNQYKLYNV